MRDALPRLLTLDEAAAALHATVTPGALRAAIAAGQLAGRRIGRRFYVSEIALQEFVRCPAPANPPASFGIQETANGSFTMARSGSGRAAASRAADLLLKRRSADI